MEKLEEIILKLDKKDKKKLSEFAEVLIKQNKYNKLREELEIRKAEIKNGEVLSHKELWQNG